MPSLPLLLVTAIAAVSCLVSTSHAQNITYNVAATLAWLNAQGCSNASTNPTCPGGYVCYDDEFTARALAAGGVVTLNPNDPSPAPYQNYVYAGNTYDLTTQTGPPAGLYDFLLAIGWYNPELPGCSPTNETACYPAGAVIMTTNIWQQPIPLMAIGNGMCSCWSPLNTGAPHCDMPCPFFDGGELFFPPPPISDGPLFGSYTPNNQTFQDFTLWPNMFNTPTDSINQAISVLEVGWSANDASTVLTQLELIWTIEQAVPMITWMPYPYATWTAPSPNEDIVNGLYDTYIAQFLAMLSKWVGTNKRVYLRFAPQPNGNWFPWSPTCPSCATSGQKINQTVESYVAMFQYVIGKVRSNTYTLTPDVLQVVYDVNNADAEGSGTAEAFYPGASNAQWIMVTGMNWGNTLPGNQWSTPTQVLEAMRARMHTLSPTSPLAVSAATTSHPNGVAAKGTWITQYFSYAVSSGVKMMLYHNADSSTDLAVFGGSGGDSTWTSPLSNIEYNVYTEWSTALNTGTLGIQGENPSDPRIITNAQFTGNF